MPDRRPLRAAHNADLVGRAGSRRQLSTPALVLDLDALERNVARMAAHCRAHRIALRPHTKTHKSVAIARLQLDAGAVGICCAKVSEAEVMAGGGIERILVTSPIVAERAANALAALAREVRELIAVADSREGVEQLGAAAARAGSRFGVLVDVDVGTMRTGAASVEHACAIADQIASHPHLELAGLQGYAGHVMHLERLEGRRAASLDALARLTHVREALKQRGLDAGVVSGGGTGTYDIDPAAGVLSELQAGSYVFMDREYEELEYSGGAPPFERSLFVHTTVISCNHPGLGVTDAGFKAFATDGPKPAIHSGAPQDSSYVFMGDEHGAVLMSAPDAVLPVGTLVVCTPPHCDPTVNLYDAYHCVRGDTLVDIWPVDARGCTV